MSKNFGTNEKTAEAFVACNRASGHNDNKTMRFDGSVLWSYQTRVAKFVIDGDKLVLCITSKRYSLTTSRHLTLVRCAWEGEVRYVSPDFF